MGQALLGRAMWIGGATSGLEPWPGQEEQDTGSKTHHDQALDSPLLSISLQIEMTSGLAMFEVLEKKSIRTPQLSPCTGGSPNFLPY